MKSEKELEVEIIQGTEETFKNNPITGKRVLSMKQEQYSIKRHI